MLPGIHLKSICFCSAPCGNPVGHMSDWFDSTNFKGSKGPSFKRSTQRCYLSAHRDISTHIGEPMKCYVGNNCEMLFSSYFELDTSIFEALVAHRQFPQWFQMREMSEPP